MRLNELKKLNPDKIFRMASGIGLSHSIFPRKETAKSTFFSQDKSNTNFWKQRGQTENELASIVAEMTDGF